MKKISISRSICLNWWKEIHFIFVEILDWQISVDLSPHIWIAILVKWSKTQHCCLQRRLAVHLVLVYLSTADKVYILCRCLNPQPTLCNLPATCRTSLHNQATPLKGVKLWTFQSFHPFMFFLNIILCCMWCIHFYDYHISDFRCWG